MIELIQTCAVNVPTPIVQAIVATESSFNPLAINVNKAAQINQPKSYSEAVYKAKDLIAKGYSIDMGLSQINSKNLNWLNLTVEQVFNPCTNLKALQTVYLSCYNQALNGGDGTREQRAFSCYNTGNIRSGFSNGYVNKVTKNLNKYLSKNNNLLKNPLPRDSNGLANYANSLNNQTRNLQELDENSNVEKIEEPQFSAWDIFKDFNYKHQ